MDRRTQPHAAGGVDRLSKLDDAMLGHVLSFLPSKEAARAAALSSRYRHAYAAGVHTVSLDGPVSPIDDSDDYGGGYSPGNRPPNDPNPPPRFSQSVDAALLARHRGGAGAVPLRALRVSMMGCSSGDGAMVDQWLSYAVHQAAPALEVHLRLRPFAVCSRADSLDEDEEAEAEASCPRPSQREMERDVGHCDGNFTSESRGCVAGRAEEDDHGDSSPRGSDGGVFSSDEDEEARYHRARRYVSWNNELPEYTVPKLLFSCAALRSLSLSACRLAPPAAVLLPSLETLLLAHVSDDGRDVDRLISGCPRLADLTLDRCDAVTALSILGPRLRRLALRCCHNLAAVAVNAPELQALEYRGSVPCDSFLTMHGGGGGGARSIAYGKVDICGKEATSEEELVKLRQFLQLFVDVKHLHLESTRLGSGMHKDVPVSFPFFPSLVHLELRGRLPGDDDAIVAAVTTILEHAPNLEEVSLVFHPENDGPDKSRRGYGYYDYKEEELLESHHLRQPHAAVDAPSNATIPACLRRKVREVNLVHYQGGRAQRTVAKFLLCNAPAIEELWCEFAEGPLGIQTELMREMRGWVMNKSARTHFG